MPKADCAVPPEYGLMLPGGHEALLYSKFRCFSIISVFATGPSAYLRLSLTMIRKRSSCISVVARAAT